jgi:hypothetical protein
MSQCSGIWGNSKVQQLLGCKCTDMLYSGMDCQNGYPLLRLIKFKKMPPACYTKVVVKGGRIGMTFDWIMNCFQHNSKRMRV